METTIPTTTKPTSAYSVTTALSKSKTSLFHPETINTINRFYQEFIKLQSFILKKEIQLKWLATNEDLIPRSCQIKFALPPSNNLTRLNMFSELQDECTSL
eukprot:11448624-Ditylum_brightwellii.AAC.1